MQSVISVRSRLLGFLLLGTFVLAAVLLVAGYGVPVGLGAITGFILGIAAGSLGSLWLARGLGRSVSWGDGYSVSSAGPPMDMMTELRDLAEIGDVDLGATRSVTAVIATAEAGGLVVELVSIEFHTAGLVASLNVWAAPGSLQPASMARIAVSDDAGTLYRAAAQGL